MSIKKIVLPSEADYSLVQTESHLELHSLKSKIKPIYVDFLSPKIKYRCAKGGGKNQLIAKAVGLKSGIKPSVLDVTAGLGEDGFILASLGCSVHLLERSPILGALLQDGLQRWILGRPKDQQFSLSLTVIDSLIYLEGLPIDARPDVIYLDPMFPNRHRQTLQKKEMRVIRDLVGDDEDASILLEKALIFAKKRVVVKRPRLSECLPGPKPNLVISGKSSRFDVFFV